MTNAIESVEQIPENILLKLEKEIKEDIYLGRIIDLFDKIPNHKQLRVIEGLIRVYDLKLIDMYKSQDRKKRMTKFGEWRLNQPEFKKGYAATDIDLYLKDHNTGNFMFFEEKIYGKEPEWWQVEMLAELSLELINSFYFFGCHVIIFEKDSPITGKIFVDSKEMSLATFKEFLAFKLSPEFYSSRYILSILSNASIQRLHIKFEGNEDVERRLNLFR